MPLDISAAPMTRATASAICSHGEDAPATGGSGGTDGPREPDFKLIHQVDAQRLERRHNARDHPAPTASRRENASTLAVQRGIRPSRHVARHPLAAW